jgi:hypothetical protein
VQSVGYKLLYVFQLHGTRTILKNRLQKVKNRLQKVKNICIISCWSDMQKSHSTCHICQHRSQEQTCINILSAYWYEYTKFFKLTVLCNNHNSKRVRRVQNISHKHASKIAARLKTLITCRNDILMKYERRIYKTTIAWNYTEVRKVSLLGDWRVRPNTVCALSCKTSL